MGRHEKPLDPADGPVQSLAFELRKLRQEAGGPTYRAMARKAGYSGPTLSAAAAGERLPSLPVLLAYAEACGGDPVWWEKRWRDALRSAANGADDGSPAPYRGLDRFGPDDRGLFFGRDDSLAELLVLTRRSRFTAVVGASGSGKSSLLRAGLVPALREETRDRPRMVRMLTPGERPVRAHRQALTPAAGEGDTVVLVDQFEEAFTLCHDAAERREFIDLLLAARAPGSRLRVVVAVRADFFGRCVERPELAAAVADSTLLVAPMQAAQLREAIVKPAAARRLTVERSLTARIVADVADEPGGLPLMSHALLEVWRRRMGKVLTLAAYEAIGGVQGAIAHTAEEVFRDFTDAQAAVARSVLLRLVAPGDGTQDTRRPALRAELSPVGGDGAGDREAVVERLVRARLLTVDDGTVNLAHEALITAWPRLRGWADEARDRLRVHRRLTDAAHGWHDLGRDPGALYRGLRLTAAREAFGTAAADGELNALERAFLAASTAEDERAAAAAARGVRRRRALTVALSVLLCVSLVAGVSAWRQSRTSARQRDEAEARRVAAAADTLRYSDPKTAMRLSLAAWRTADLPETRASLAGALAQPEEDAFSQQDTVSQQDTASQQSDGFAQYSLDGRLLTVVGAERTDRWDTAAHRALPAYPGMGSTSRRQDVLAISHDGRKAVYLDQDGMRLWDLASGRPTGKPFGRAEHTEARFSPSGRTIMVNRSNTKPDPSIQIWDARTGKLLLDAEQQLESNLHPVVSPDEALVAVCPDGGRLQVWDIARRRRLPVTFEPAVPSSLCGAEQFQFTPDSDGIAFTTGGAVRTWDVRTGAERPRIEVAGLHDAVFQDGYAATESEQEIDLWRADDPSAPVFDYPLKDTGVKAGALSLDLRHGQLRYQEGAASGVRTLRLPATLGGPLRRPLDAAELSPDGEVLATAEWHDGAQQVSLWDAESGRTEATLRGLTCRQCRQRLSFSADSRTVAVLTGKDPDKGVTLRSLGKRPRSTRKDATPKDATPADATPADATPADATPADTMATRSTSIRPGPAPYPGIDSPVGGLALDPHGRSVAVSRAGIEIWSAGGHRVLRRNRQDTYGNPLRMSPDGRRLLTDGNMLVDMASGRATPVMRGEDNAENAAISPDGRYLAMSDSDGRVTLWDGLGRHRLAVLSPGSSKPRLLVGGSYWYIPALAFSADSRTVAVGGTDGSIRMWATGSPDAPPPPLPSADGPVLALAFADGGDVLRAATPNTPVHGYSLDPRDMAGKVCARAGSGLSRADWHTYLPSVPYRATCG